MIEQQDQDFLRAFWERRVVVAYVLFALNILIFILMTFAGGWTNEATQLAFGVKSNPEINNGEIWRFVTPIFIHFGLMHLAFNSYALWILGPHVEKLYGPARFLFLYVMTGIAGVVASYFYHPTDVSAGASGAIFGLLGVLLVFSFKYRKSVPAFFTKALSRGILITIVINVVIGLLPQIDMSAHLGGLVAGGMLALVVPYQRPGEISGRGYKALESVLVLLVALSFLEVAVHYNGPGLSFQNLSAGLAGNRSVGIGGFIEAINAGQAAFEKSDEELSSDNVRNLQRSREDLAKAIQLMQHIPSLSGPADQLSSELLDLLQKQYAYIEEVERSGKTRSDFIGASPVSSRYKRNKQAIEEWVNREGSRYGIQNTN